MRVTETAHWLEWQDWSHPVLREPYAVSDGTIAIPDVPVLVWNGMRARWRGMRWRGEVGIVGGLCGVRLHRSAGRITGNN